jgi:hypothetical protein
MLGRPAQRARTQHRRSAACNAVYSISRRASLITRLGEQLPRPTRKVCPRRRTSSFSCIGSDKMILTVNQSSQQWSGDDGINTESTGDKSKEQGETQGEAHTPGEKKDFVFLQKDKEKQKRKKRTQESTKHEKIEKKREKQIKATEKQKTTEKHTAVSQRKCAGFTPFLRRVKNKKDEETMRPRCAVTTGPIEMKIGANESRRGPLEEAPHQSRNGR